ncbi:dynamin family protein [Moraxella catarrhalis]|uniref:dynamin family protein n=1 Tax=Moraxella catarrhalis TaxID=480 RepID=UPI0013D5B354|nr:dynamin family protein [Moraxella catarrhalis]
MLAVVGTMKAGKSTTINAIVGREIMPNRNRPMTALPTLICHNAEQHTPKLKINSSTLNGFLNTIRPSISQLNIKDDYQDNKDMIELIEFIDSGKKFQDECMGEENIFEFLKQLNDLVRLAKHIENHDSSIKFPFDDYKNFKNLPMIEVAFNITVDTDTNGRFMLLDTAGPNEAGQEELITSLEEQLERSSAVMVVLDYTQLNSQAEADIKAQIDKIPTIQKNRLFALVNKFDQKNANSDDKDSTKKHIFNNLLKDKIELDNIYPISAYDTYLGYRMTTALKSEKPAYDAINWVGDLASKLYGRRPEQTYNVITPEELAKDIQDLLDDSLMQEPIEKVIINMQKNAPLIAIQSALVEANDVFNNLNNKLNIGNMFAEKGEMTQKEIDELNQTITSLENRLADLQADREKISNKIEQVKQDIDKNINLDGKIELLNNQVKLTIDEYLGRENEDIKQEQDELVRKNQGLGYLLRLARKETLRKEREELDKLRERAKLDGNKLIFSNMDDLQSFGQELEQQLVHYAQNNIMSSFTKILKKSENQVVEVVKDVQQDCLEILSQMSDDFAKKGVALRIEFNPMGKLKKHAGRLNRFKLNVHTEEHTGTRKQSGILGGIKRGFGGLFGKSWGTYKVDYETHTIDIDEINTQLTESIKDEIILPLKEQVQEKTSALLDQSLNYINKFESTIDDIVAEFKQGMEQEKHHTSRNIQEKEQYYKAIMQNKKVHDEVKEDWDSIARIFDVQEIA